MSKAYSSIYLGLLNFSQQCFVIFSLRPFTSFVTFILKSFIFFDAILKFQFPIVHCQYIEIQLIFVYQYCILYLPKLISFCSIFAYCTGISTETIMLFMKKTGFFSLSNLDSFYFFFRNMISSGFSS